MSDQMEIEVWQPVYTATRLLGVGWSDEAELSVHRVSESKPQVSVLIVVFI